MFVKFVNWLWELFSVRYTLIFSSNDDIDPYPFYVPFHRQKAFHNAMNQFGATFKKDGNVFYFPHISDEEFRNLLDHLASIAIYLPPN